MATKETILLALRVFAAQRPGLEFGNYCSGWNDKTGRAAYFAEMRQITRTLHDARELLRSVELSSITAEQLLAAFPRAYSGRLTAAVTEKGIALDYCAGQYYPTEYRRAVCAVLASALWDYKRANMPAPAFVCGDGVTFKTLEEARAYVANPSFAAVISIEERYEGKSAGEWIRDSFKREYGRGIAARWFS